MKYEERDIELYDEYMEFVYRLIMDSDIPARTKKRMLSGAPLKVKNQDIWYITYKRLGFTKQLEFQSFRYWLRLMQLQEERTKKLDQLLNESN